MNPPPGGYPICRHCQQRCATRGRGLCFTCHNTPAVRELYPVHSLYGARNYAVHGGGRPPPAPTAAAPGSPSKVAVLIERARQRVDLWHPDDGPE